VELYCLNPGNFVVLGLTPSDKGLLKTDLGLSEDTISPFPTAKKQANPSISA
jgi:hypothetical protein